MMRRLRQEQGGFTMIATMIGATVVMSLAVVAATAVRGDISFTARDIASKKAYEAARAGVEDYAAHLYAESLYWTKCTSVPAPSPVNPQGSTVKRRAVPGDPNTTYAIELLPATTQSTYTQCSTANPGGSMLETSGPASGSFRIRSNGFAGDNRVGLVANFKRPSFLDYVYFTQLETLDPIAYGYPNPSTALTGAYSQCELTWEQGRENRAIPGTGGRDFCSTISFITGDEIEGPLHTNDSISTCGSPRFGRTITDMIEIGGSFPGYHSDCSGTPIFTGTRVTSAPILVPPESNSKLATIAEPAFRYTGQVRICLSGATMTVGNGSGCTGLYSGPIPPNGVIYVKSSSCPTVYSPFGTDYETTSGCGNAYVRGIYTGKLTIAAENDVIIDGNLCRTSCSSSSGEALLGLIANNFVRVYHPCSSDSNRAGSITNPTIHAAILAIQHSFIVDNYDCGSTLGTLTVEGAIAQKFRGPVGQSSYGRASSGYTKNYVYDDRLRYLEPPSFIEPTGSAWVIGRLTEG
jgi:type II secretory pathway pseudopilin PulG